ncbi:alpha-glucosidase-like [Belonocnema kinseyi]|uniref:alpha-glucosidase-like n=1 Tax=Belonocnema kinseyi TaxID=2817044 RepID=UPI00143DDAB1|nr:alpha-glucosidase-like [Belonocnema kinseyi]
MKVFLALWVTTVFACNVKGEQSWWQSMSIYQIFPRSFMDSDGDGIGDIKGIISRLDHLVELKIDAFWFCPVYKSPMVDNGYDVSNFTEIDPIFGTMEDFESLVKRAHDLKLKVILDFVPNHSSDQHEWFKKSVAGIEPYADYYVWHKGRIVDGTIQVPNNWVRIFTAINFTTIRILKIRIQAAYKNVKVSLAIAKPPISAIDKKILAEKPHLHATHAVRLRWNIGNHDTRRLASRLGILRAMAFTALVLLLPGVASTYYGEEIGMLDAPIVITDLAYFRDPERSLMQWDNSTSAGFSTNPNTWLAVNPNYKTLNLEAEKVCNESYYNYYKALASLRNLPAVRSGNMKMEILDNDVLVFSRYLKEEKSVYVLINFADQMKTVSLRRFENTPEELAFYRATPGLRLKSGTLIKTDEINVPSNATMVFVDIKNRNTVN